jgi:hypothetical protein
MSSTPTSTSTTSTSTAPAIPEAARANTPQGAEAFTRFFADQANRAYDNLDPAVIQSLSAPGCKTCESMVTSLTLWRDSNYKYEGKFVTPTSITISAFPQDGTAKTVLMGSSSDARVLDNNGTVVQKFAAQSASSSVFLSYEAGQWKVTEIKRAA